MPLDGISNSREVTIRPLGLGGFLDLPREAAGIVILAHGSASGCFSPRNHFVARGLNDQGVATLLLDLLREEEAQDRTHVVDIRLLAQRLLTATAWVKQQPEVELAGAWFTSHLQRASQ